MWPWLRVSDCAMIGVVFSEVDAGEGGSFIFRIDQKALAIDRLSA